MWNVLLGCDSWWKRQLILCIMMVSLFVFIVFAIVVTLTKHFYTCVKHLALVMLFIFINKADKSGKTHSLSLPKNYLLFLKNVNLVEQFFWVCSWSKKCVTCQQSVNLKFTTSLYYLLMVFYSNFHSIILPSYKIKLITNIGQIMPWVLSHYSFRLCNICSWSGWMFCNFL